LIILLKQVWIALEEKGDIEYTYREASELDVLGEQTNDKHSQVNPYKKEPEFIRVNPLGLVPVSFCLLADPLHSMK
jgi:glutathione S-transferase